jgi:hypothetical protein
VKQRERGAADEAKRGLSDGKCAKEAGDGERREENDAVVCDPVAAGCVAATVAAVAAVAAAAVAADAAAAAAAAAAAGKMSRCTTAEQEEGTQVAA